MSIHDVLFGSNKAAIEIREIDIMDMTRVCASCQSFPIMQIVYRDRYGVEIELFSVCRECAKSLLKNLQKYIGGINEIN